MDDIVYEDLNPFTRKAYVFLWQHENRDYGDIYDAYKEPSCYKVNSYNAIERTAEATPGYNNDLKVVGKSCHYYSTSYSYTDGGQTFIVHNTCGHRYRVAV